MDIDIDVDVEIERDIYSPYMYTIYMLYTLYIQYIQWCSHRTETYLVIFLSYQKVYRTPTMTSVRKQATTKGKPVPAEQKQENKQRKPKRKNERYRDTHIYIYTDVARDRDSVLIDNIHTYIYNMYVYIIHYMYTVYTVVPALHPDLPFHVLVVSKVLKNTGGLCAKTNNNQRKQLRLSKNKQISIGNQKAKTNVV